MLKKYKQILNEKGEVYLRVKVHPGSARNEVKDVLGDDTIKVDISAIPEKGKANKVLIGFLAKEFDVLARNVKIISGAGTPLKLLKIQK